MRRLVPVMLTALFLVGVAGSAQYELDVQLAEMQVVVENEYLTLYLDHSTTEIAVLDKRSQVVWYSNPANRGQDERLARGVTREMLNAQLAITYYAPGDLQRSMNNYHDSIVHGQFAITRIDDGVRVDYGFGKKWEADACLPVMISQQRMEDLILGRLDDRDASLITKSYTLIWLEEIDDPDLERVSVYNIDKEAVFGNYTLGADVSGFTERAKRDLYNLLADRLVENRTDLSGRRGITAQDVEQLKDTPTYILNARVSTWDRKDIVELLNHVGYTPEDAGADHLANHLDPRQPSIVRFAVPLEYILDGPELIVRIPLDEVEYPVDVPTNVFVSNSPKATIPLHSIDVLPYFGAANQFQTGYIFVPDGSGALIRLNNGKTYAPPFKQPVFGNDSALVLERERSISLEQIYLPVFGLKQGDHSFFAIIEEGAPMASIKADIAGRVHSYNVISSEFAIIPKGEASLQAPPPQLTNWLAQRDVINIYQPRITSGDIRIRYSFLSGDDATYVGMARYYQAYLAERLGLKPKTSQPGVPFFAELVGGISVERPVLGVPREVIEPVTTFAQVAQIADELIRGGVNNLHLRYTGWLRGGVHHVYPNAVKLESRLGDQAELARLSRYLQEREIGFYPDVNFLNVPRTSLFDGFSERRDASRYFNRQRAVIPEYDPVTYQVDANRFSYVLSPARLEGLVESFLQDYGKYGINGLALREMGVQVNSDHREGALIDRVQATAIMTKQLERVGEAGYEIMVDGGNAWALPYADVILNSPVTSSGHYIVDESIPFYPMAVRAYVDYAGEPINLAPDSRQAMLKTLEIGSGLYYKWFFADSPTVKETPFASLYAAHYSDWLAEAIEFYHAVDQALGDVYSQPITAHEKLAENVYMTTFANKKAVVVNYSRQAVQFDRFAVGGEDYVVLSRALAEGRIGDGY